MTLAMREFLRWVSERPRTYRDAMDAWKSSCPRLTVWEDALHEGFIRIEPASPGNEAAVLLTEAGSAAIRSRD